MDYQFKLAGRGEIKYSLHDTNLSVYYEKSKEQINLQLSEIKKVWLMADWYSYYTYLYTDNKKFNIVLTPRNKSKEYITFLRELHSKLASLYSNVKFNCGSAPLAAYEWGAVIVGIFILLFRYILVKIIFNTPGQFHPYIFLRELVHDNFVI